jgi:hypothetical protein
MQLQPEIKETVHYQVGNNSCYLSFFRYSDPDQPHPLYGVELEINGVPLQQIHGRNDVLHPGDPFYKITRSIVLATQQVLDQWCVQHAQVFITFSDYDDELAFFSLYRLFGFVPSGRLDTFLCYVNDVGQRTAFKGMLNLLGKDDFAVNDIWRFTKICDYYIGDYQTPVDVFKEMLAGAPGIEVVSSQSNHQ